MAASWFDRHLTSPHSLLMCPVGAYRIFFFKLTNKAFFCTCEQGLIKSSNIHKLYSVLFISPALTAPPQCERGPNDSEAEHTDCFYCISGSGSFPERIFVTGMQK